MQTYRTETIVEPNHILVIRDLPFRAGEKVEVVIVSISQKTKDKERYPLRGMSFRYDAPFDSVAEEDWEILQ